MADHLRHNLAVLAQRSPGLARRVAEAAPPEASEVYAARSGDPALKVRGVGLTSSVDPRAEGLRQALAAPLGDLACLGLALGYHLEPLTGRDLVIYEPDPGVVRLALTARDLTGLLHAARLVCDLGELGDLAGRSLYIHRPTVRLHPQPARALERLLAAPERRPVRPARPRVLVAPPVLGGSLPMAYWCAEALEALGCQVMTLPMEAVAPLYEVVRRSRADEARLDQVRAPMVRFLGEALCLAAEEMRPDLMLAMAQAPLGQRALRRLGALEVPTAFWFVENHRHMTYFREVGAEYDFFFHIQGPELAAELDRLGANHAFLPVAAHPPVHRPLALTPGQEERWGAPVGFMGCGYPNRRKVFSRLAGRGFAPAIWGSGWPARGELAALVRENGRRVTTPEVVKIYNACAVVLNLHSSPEAGDGLARADFINPRTYEVAACGGFQLVDRVAGLEQMLAPGREVAVFEHEDEMVEMARHYLARPEERAAMAAAARRRVLDGHTYYHRMESLLTACLGPAPEVEEPAPQRAAPAWRAAEMMLQRLAPEAAGLADQGGS